jgi:hypothetical protein
MTDDDVKRATDAFREAVMEMRKGEYHSALCHAELGSLLLRIAASKTKYQR